MNKFSAFENKNDWGIECKGLRPIYDQDFRVTIEKVPEYVEREGDDLFDYALEIQLISVGVCH